jgi:hypothetical protein
LLVLAVPFGIPQQFATESVWSNLLQESIPWLSGRNDRKVAGSIEIGVKTIKMKMERS